MFARLSSRLFGGKKAAPRDPESLEEACAYLEGESEEELQRALLFIGNKVIRKGLPSSACLSLVLNCLGSDFGKMREEAFKLFHSIFQIRDIHYDVVRRKIAKELGLGEHVGAVRAALSLLNSMDVPYRVQFACSKIGTESIRKGMIVADPDIRGEIFLGVGRLLPVVWWYIDSSADEVDGLYYRNVSVYDGELKCDWSAEECARVKEDVSELCKQFYSCCAQGLIGEATTTDTMGNTVDLPDSGAAFNGCSLALVYMMQIDNLRRRGLSVDAQLTGLLGALDTSYGDGTVLPFAADPVSYPGSISNYSGVRHSLVCHALSSSVGPFVQTFIHTCLAYMGAITDRARAEASSGEGLLLVSLALQAVLFEVDQEEPLASVRVLAKIKEKYRFGDEEERGAASKPKCDASPMLLPLLEGWADAVMEVLRAPDTDNHPRPTQLKLLLARELVQVLRDWGCGAAPLVAKAGPELLSWLLEPAAAGATGAAAGAAAGAGAGAGATAGAGAAARDEERSVKAALAAILIESLHEPPLASLEGALEAAVSLGMTCPSLGSARVLASCVSTCLSLHPSVVPAAVKRGMDAAWAGDGTGLESVGGLKVVMVAVLRTALCRLHQSIAASSAGTATEAGGGECGVAGACSAVVGCLRLFLPVLGDRCASGKVSGEEARQSVQACLLAWVATASAASALLFPSYLAAGTSVAACPSLRRDEALLGFMREDLSASLRGLVQTLRPHRSAPTDASCALLRLLCRHCLSMSRHTAARAESPAKTEEGVVAAVKQMWALLVVWLDGTLGGPPTDTHTDTPVVNQDPPARSQSGAEGPLLTLRRFGASLSGCEASGDGVGLAGAVSTFQGVVPSPHQLDTPSAALELCLDAYFHAAAAKRAKPSSGFPGEMAILIGGMQAVLERYCHTTTSAGAGAGARGRGTHAMLVEECSRAQGLIRAATGIPSPRTGGEDEDEGGGRRGRALSPSTSPSASASASASASLQLRGCISGHWAARGDMDGIIMSSPLPAHTQRDTDATTTTAAGAGAGAGAGGGGDGDDERSAALTQALRRLAVQKSTPLAAVERALQAACWTDAGEARFRQTKHCPASFLPASEVVASVDDIAENAEPGLGLPALPPTAGAAAAAAEEEEKEEDWSCLDELPEPPCSRVYSQLSGSGDLLTVLGSSLYDHQARCAVFHLRVCNSAGFSVPSLQLRGEQTLLSSPPSSPPPSPPPPPEGRELLSPIFAYLEAGAVADHVFRVPVGTPLVPVQLRVSVIYSGLIEEGNGAAPSLLRGPALRSAFGDCSTTCVRPLTLPLVAMLRPYGLGLWRLFSRPAWRERGQIWRDPKDTMLRQLPSRAMAARGAGHSQGGVPAYVFEQLWQAAAPGSSLPAIIPLQSPVARYGEEVLLGPPYSSSSSTSEQHHHLAAFVDQAITLADAGVGGAALPGSLSVCSAAQVLLPASGAAAGGGGATLHRRRLAWALQSPSPCPAQVCVLVSMWTTHGSSGADGSRARVRVFAEAEVRSSDAATLAALTESNVALDSLLMALSGDSLSVDMEARAKMGPSESSAMSLQRERVSDDWALAVALDRS